MTVDERTTAAQRGPGWMVRYDCPEWCVMDHAGGDGEPGWHQGPWAEVVSPKAVRHPDDPETVLRAYVTQVNEDAQVFGRETRLWVDTDGATMALDVAETDKLIADLEQILPCLRALREQLAEVTAGDFPADPVAKAKYMAEQDARIKVRTAELLAAEANPTTVPIKSG